MFQRKRSGQPAASLDVQTTPPTAPSSQRPILARRAFLKSAVSAVSLAQLPNKLLTSLLSESALAAAPTIAKAAVSKNILGGILNLVKSSHAFYELNESKPRAGFTAWFLTIDDEAADRGDDKYEGFKYVAVDEIKSLEQRCEEHPHRQVATKQAFKTLVASRDALLAAPESKLLLQTLKPACLKINQESKDFFIKKLAQLSEQLPKGTPTKDKEKLQRLVTLVNRSKSDDRALIGDQKKWVRILNGIDNLEETYCNISSSDENCCTAVFSEFQHSLVSQAEESALLAIGLTPANAALFRQRLEDYGTNLFQLFFGHVSSLLPDIESTVNGRLISISTGNRGVGFLDPSFNEYEQVLDAEWGEHYQHLQAIQPQIAEWYQWRDQIIKSTNKDPAKPPTLQSTPKLPEPFELSETGYVLLSPYDIAERLGTETPSALSLLTWITNFRDLTFSEIAPENHNIRGLESSSEIHSVGIALESEESRQVLVITSDTFLQATISSKQDGPEQVALICGDILVVDCSVVRALSLSAGSCAEVQVVVNKLVAQPTSESNNATHNRAILHSEAGQKVESSREMRG